MNEKITARLLRASLDELRQARAHLTFSAQRVGQLGGERSDWSEADLEKSKLIRDASRGWWIC